MKRSAFFRVAILIAVLVTVIVSPIMEAYASYSLILGIHDVRGILPKGDISSPLKLKSAEFTFNVPEFPETNYENESIAASEYDANVVTKYVFYNPAEDTVTDSLLFCMGDLPEYIGEIDHGKTAVNDLTKYGVKVNGEAPEITVRHSAQNHNRYIIDDYKETWLKSYTVTHYQYKVNVDCSCECIVVLYSNSDSVNRNLIAYGGNKRYGIVPADSYLEIPVDPSGSDSVIDVWCIGEPMDDTVKTGFYVLSDRKYDQYSQINGALEILEEQTVSFTEFAFSTYDPQSGVSEIDHYNAVVDKVGSSGHNYINCDFKNFDSTLYRWYQFDVTVPAGETATVETTAPLYPDVDDRYTPFVYTYDCNIYLTLAIWKDVESLTATVVTPYHSFIINDELELEKTEEGYRYVFFEPEAMWEFSLSASPAPEHNFHEPEPSPKPEDPPYKAIFTALLLVPLLAAVVIAVILQMKRDEGLGVMGVLCDIWLWFVKIAVPVLSIACTWVFANGAYDKIGWVDGNLYLILACVIIFVSVIISKALNRFRKAAAWKRVDKIVLNIYLLLPVASLISANLLADFIFFYM